VRRVSDAGVDGKLDGLRRGVDSVSTSSDHTDRCVLACVIAIAL
jgi:hypothetical protein